MCCQAQAIDQQPLKTAQFYVISWKSEGLSAIEYTPQACTPTVSAQLKSVGFHYRDSNNLVTHQQQYVSCCIYCI